MTEEQLSSHWLWRLDAADWLAAADRELLLAKQNRERRRTTLTHTRRAAGMYLNAVLVADHGRGHPRAECESKWGRSYVDHLRAISGDGPCTPLPESARKLARELLSIPLQPGGQLIDSKQLIPRKKSMTPQDKAIDLGEKLAELCRSAVAENSTED